MWTPEEITRWERNLTAMCRSAGTNDPEAFAELVRLVDWLESRLLPEAYAQLRAQGFSVREIARPLPCTAQAAWAKYANR